MRLYRMTTYRPGNLDLKAGVPQVPLLVLPPTVAHRSLTLVWEVGGVQLTIRVPKALPDPPRYWECH